MAAKIVFQQLLFYLGTVSVIIELAPSIQFRCQEMAVETGLQLLGRLTSRPSLAKINPTLFPNDLKPKEVVEICGDPASGKTHLLTSLIAKCILPETFKHFYIGGLQAGVILLNTDLHFQIFKLVGMLDNHLKCCRSDDGSSMESSEIENIIKTALTNLNIYNCTDSFVFRITIHSLQQTVASNSKLSLIILDSVSANYWQDVHQGGVKKIDLYTSKMLKNLQKLVTDFNLSMIYTRPTYFKSAAKKTDKTVSQHSVFGCVNHRIELTFSLADLGVVFYRAEIRCYNKVLYKYYKITSDGFEWMELDKLPTSANDEEV